ncbi:hypothetical protein HOLleu_08876 [Holothuria leucospilota]|uniref:Uncharacterized protein n=1 Tax=Holothuria leucospilota TaxID=206669 RepID=A0A9Q1HI84_HOLLE|nr:hypothetical protein HOLleu_08876 [Holothuria leucospilota]
MNKYLVVTLVVLLAMSAHLIQETEATGVVGVKEDFHEKTGTGKRGVAGESVDPPPDPEDYTDDDDK